MNIGSPPEFGEDSSPPLLTSAPVEITRWGLDKTLAEFLQPEVEAIKRKAPGTITLAVTNFVFRGSMIRFSGPEADFAVKSAILTFLKRKSAKDVDWRKANDWQLHAVYEYFWRREDPVTQLPPGGSVTAAVSLRVGVSKEQANEIATSLGIASASSNLGSISAQLSNKWTTKVSLSRQEEASHTVTLANPSNDAYRRLAIWHIVHRLSIVAAPTLALDPKVICQETEFVLSDATNITYVDVVRK